GLDTRSQSAFSWWVEGATLQTITHRRRHRLWRLLPPSRPSPSTRSAEHGIPRPPTLVLPTTAVRPTDKSTTATRPCSPRLSQNTASTHPPRSSPTCKRICAEPTYDS